MIMSRQKCVWCKLHLNGKLSEATWSLLFFAFGLLFCICTWILSYTILLFYKFYCYNMSTCVYKHCYMKNNTWAYRDIEFLFECSTLYLTHLLRSLMRYWIEDEKGNSISPINHVLLCLLYKHLTNKKKPT